MGERRSTVMKKYWFAVIVIILGLIVSGLYMGMLKNGSGNVEGAVITLYKTESCNCCGNYIKYLRNNGYDVEVVNINSLRAEFNRFGVPENMYSCHIAETGDYFMVGHIPVDAINKLMKEKPEIDGIALPGMPPGAPGMGGVKKAPFVIYYMAGTETGVYLEV